jgi:hypothetical protein
MQFKNGNHPYTNTCLDGVTTDFSGRTLLYEISCKFNYFINISALLFSNALTFIFLRVK